MAITLYQRHGSGHAHRVRLFLSMLGLDYERIELEPGTGKDRSADYLALNPLGQVPTLVDGDVVVNDSTAALVYLAKRYGDTRWLPETPEGAAAVQRWLSTASGELFRGPALCRAAKLFGRDLDLAAAQGWAKRLFDWMQLHLSERQWLAAEHPTIADVAMYSYLAVADEGGLELDSFPAIKRWLADVEGLEGFEPMPRARG